MSDPRITLSDRRFPASRFIEVARQKIRSLIPVIAVLAVLTSCICHAQYGSYPTYGTPVYSAPSYPSSGYPTSSYSGPAYSSSGQVISSGTPIISTSAPVVGQETIISGPVYSAGTYPVGTTVIGETRVIPSEPTSRTQSTRTQSTRTQSTQTNNSVLREVPSSKPRLSKDDTTSSRGGTNGSTTSKTRYVKRGNPATLSDGSSNGALNSSPNNLLNGNGRNTNSSSSRKSSVHASFANHRSDASSSNSRLASTQSSTSSEARTETQLASARSYYVDPRFAPISSAPKPIDYRPSIYNAERIRIARQAADDFRRLSQSASPIVAEQAAENAIFADQWADLANEYLILSNQLSEATDKLRRVSSDLLDVDTKLQQHGLTPTVGLLLRHKKDELDEWQIHDSTVLYANQALKRSQQQQLDLELINLDGSDPQAQAIDLLLTAGADPNSPQADNLTLQLERLLRQRYQWIESLREGYHDYQQKLGELDSATTDSAAINEDYRALIDRHIIWIRSGDPFKVEDLKDFDDGVGALFNSRRSGDIGYSIGQKWQANPGRSLAFFAAIGFILLCRWRAKAWLVGIGNRDRLRDASDKSRKVLAGWLTTAVAVSIPSIFYVISRWLGEGIVSAATLHSSSGFAAASLVALMVEVPRQLLRTSGYVDKHVAIDLPRRQRATIYLTLIGMGLVLAAYTITLVGQLDHGIWKNSTARIGFVAAMLLVAWTAHLSLKPSSGFLKPFIEKFGGSVVHRLRLFLYLAGLSFPLFMIALASLGYGFTARELIKRAIITLVAGCIAAALWAGIKILSSRLWGVLTTGTTEQSRVEFDSYGSFTTRKETTATGNAVLSEHYLELKHQLAFLCQCALVLVAIISFGWLWVDVFPNARIANPVVWTVQDSTSQPFIDASGQTLLTTADTSRPVTAFHLLIAGTTLFVAFQLAKLLPALFDALVLQRVSFDEAMEHLSLVIGRFLLFGVGCFIACRLVGIQWKTIQWLAVGLTIGLGFGLQDMVRNVFGGLVVLFEKPARLGDFISVGRITGRVAQQRLRTTVLADDDGREVTVPNKNFVNDEVVNWMGAGRLSLVAIEVAVNRDERPADLCRELQQLAIAQPEALLTPAPQATLVCVSKASQRIEVRAWVEDEYEASHFRDSLLRRTRELLRERSLLTKDQPEQPSVRNPRDLDSIRASSNSSRYRKRTA